MAEEIRCGHPQRDIQFAEGRGYGLRQECLQDAFDVELRDTQPAGHHLAETARPCTPDTRRDFGAPAEGRTRIMVDFRAGHAGSHAGSHDCADRRAGDRDRPDAHFVKGFDHMDMRQAARTTAAEGDSETWVATFVCRGRLVPRPAAHPLSPLAWAGPMIRTAGSASRSRFAAACTSSVVTASISSLRCSM